MKRNTCLLYSLVLAVCLFFALPVNSCASVTADEDKAEPEHIHGIYVSAYVAGTKNMMDEMIAQIDGSSINAIVIDVKNDEGNIVYDMDSELIDGLGVENILVRDMPGLIETLHEHEIYVIARCVAFRDPSIDEIKPDWMLKTQTGEIYEDNKGFNWMDPRNKEAK